MPQKNPIRLEFTTWEYRVGAIKSKGCLSYIIRCIWIESWLIYKPNLIIDNIGYQLNYHWVQLKIVLI